MITVDQLAAWKRLCDEATQGPWVGGHGEAAYNTEFNETMGNFGVVANNKAIAITGMYAVLPNGDKEIRPEFFGDFPKNMSNMDFIAAARTAVPALIAEVERLTTENARLNALIDDHLHGDKTRCGICGRAFATTDMHYGALGDDAGWVCDKCIKENSDE